MSNTDYPKDTENVFYVEGYTHSSILSLLTLIQNKWPNVDLDTITITTEYRHVEAIGYDLYDPNDYINYIVITKEL